MLGENILNLRKKEGFSQEQLGDLVGVTRQTISNWELNETAPNPEQLKLLSKALNVSIDKLLDNEYGEVLMNKINNTERLAGMVIKILKVLGIIIVSYIVFMIIAIISLAVYRIKTPSVKSSATTICSIDDKNYQIEFGEEDYFKCDECSDMMTRELKKIANFENIQKSLDNIAEYFKNKDGTCE